MHLVCFTGQFGSLQEMHEKIHEKLKEFKGNVLFLFGEHGVRQVKERTVFANELEKIALSIPERCKVVLSLSETVRRKPFQMVYLVSKNRLIAHSLNGLFSVLIISFSLTGFQAVIKCGQSGLNELGT